MSYLASQILICLFTALMMGFMIGFSVYALFAKARRSDRRAIEGEHRDD